MPTADSGADAFAPSRAGQARDGMIWYKSPVPGIEVDGSDLVLKLSMFEKALSFGGDRRVPVALVRHVEQVDRAASTARDAPTLIPRQALGPSFRGCSCTAHSEQSLDYGWVLTRWEGWIPTGSLVTTGRLRRP